MAELGHISRAKDPAIVRRAQQVFYTTQKVGMWVSVVAIIVGISWLTYQKVTGMSVVTAPVEEWSTTVEKENSQCLFYFAKGWDIKNDGEGVEFIPKETPKPGSKKITLFQFKGLKPDVKILYKKQEYPCGE